MSTSRVEIDLAALDRNIALLRRAAREGARKSGVPENSVGLCGVIKQDAYGTGAPRIAKRLASLGVDLLAVYCVSEARALADANINTPILVLMPTREFDRHDPLYRLAVRQRLHLTAHSLDQIQALGTLAGRLGINLHIHVQVDTGMSRGGSLPPEAAQVARYVLASPRLKLAGLMTHFSSPSADDAFTREQARLFRHWVDALKPDLTEAVRKGAEPVMVHCANTAASLRSHNLHGTMLRVGQGMYGYGGEGWGAGDEPEFKAIGEQLEPAMRWLSRIVHVQEVPAGWPVGYDRTWTADRPSRIAIVPVGYADGYPRALSNRGYLRLTGLDWDRPRTIGPMEDRPDPGTPGVYARIVGRVSMDQVTIDVTDCPLELASPGMEVELVGVDKQAPNHLPVLATLSDSITHELMCRISPALERVYVSSAERESATQPRILPQVVVKPQRTIRAGV